MFTVMRVIEIFRSVQGEGPHQGEDAVFIRTAYCNLFCKWCDTKYSWHPLKVKSLGITMGTFHAVDMKPQEVVSIAMGISGGVKHAVLTGGEPLIWRRELIDVVKSLKAFDWFIEIETNGTISPGELVNFVDEFNVSIKLSNSGIPEKMRIIGGVIEEFVNAGNAVFKFVVDSWDDYTEILELIERFRIPRDKVYLMSQCTTKEECLVKDELITKPMAFKLGSKYTTRLHIINGFK